MPSSLVRQPAPAEIELAYHRDELSGIRGLLAELESEVADLRIQLRAFEGRYLRQVGVLYAELDDLEAQIAEREAVLYDSDAARARAGHARQRANATHEAAYGDDSHPGEIEPSPDLKRLFRDVAKRIHPDFASTPADQQHFTLLMGRANKAYGRGDTDALQRILDDFQETDESTPGEDTQADLVRVRRQIQHARRDVAALEDELLTLPEGEIAQFQKEAEAAQREGRDLLAELALTLRERIAAAQYRSQFLDRQMYAQGR